MKICVSKGCRDTKLEKKTNLVPSKKNWSKKVSPDQTSLLYECTEMGIKTVNADLGVTNMLPILLLPSRAWR